MVAKGREKNVLLGVHNSDLFDPMIRNALDLVEEGRIGKVLAVDILRSSDYPAYSAGPLPKLVTQGSYPFRARGVHGLYTIEAFAGEVPGLALSCSSTGDHPPLQSVHWSAPLRAGNPQVLLLLPWHHRPTEKRRVSCRPAATN